MGLSLCPLQLKSPYTPAWVLCTKEYRICQNIHGSYYHPMIILLICPSWLFPGSIPAATNSTFPIISTNTLGKGKHIRNDRICHRNSIAALPDLLESEESVLPTPLAPKQDMKLFGSTDIPAGSRRQMYCQLYVFARTWGIRILNESISPGSRAGQTLTVPWYGR